MSKRQDLTLKVNEIFGPTIQGEGPAAGQPALFLRVANCNLSPAFGAYNVLTQHS